MKKEIISEVVKLLSPYADEIEDIRLGEFLSLSVGRILIKKQSLNILNSDLRHIADWIKAAIINDASWISNLDDQNRPKKLMKFSSIEQITQEADKAMIIAAQKFSNIKLIEGDEELYKELDEGYYIVRLLTPAALDRESAQMQHCIGEGAYDNDLRNPKNAFLSLRDQFGKAHATLEVSNGALLQLEGKQNKRPIQKYLDVLIPFINNQKYEVRVAPKSLGYVIDINGDWHDLYNLPRKLIVNNLNLKHFKEDITLPEELYVKNGDLELTHSNISKLPKVLVVDGSLDLASSEISELPEGLSVGRNLYILKTHIKKIPSTINVSGYIFLSDASIEEIEDNIIINDDLNIINCPQLRNLPDRLSIKGSLTIFKSGIKELPDNLHVGKTLFINNTDISVLPSGLNVGTGIVARENQINHIADEVARDIVLFSDSQGPMTLSDYEDKNNLKTKMTL